MLVVAGAGTGKTTVLTERIARLIREGKAKAGEIMAVTFTDDAAAEIQSRLESLLGTAAIKGLQAGTFHSYCFALLKRAGKDFKLLDEQDLYVYLRRRLPELRLEHFTKAASPAEFLYDLLKFFSRCHDELVGPDEYAEYVREVCEGKRPVPRVCPSKEEEQLPLEAKLARCRELARVYRKVEEMLAADGLGTFGHQIGGAVRLLRADEGLLASERKRAKFILIDEFQDSNLAQIELAHLLGGREQNVFAVGDPDQAIYRFRGATSGAFEQFLARFAEVRTVTLEENQRSTPPILQCAYGLISRNSPIVRSRLEFQRAPLRSAREERAREAGERLPAPAVEVFLGGDDLSEANTVARTVRDRHEKEDRPWKDFAVLYRMHGHRDELVNELTQLGIPYEVVGLDVFDTTPVRDAMAVLRSLVTPDDTVSVLRAASLLPGAIDPRELRHATATAPRDARLSALLEKVKGGTAVLAALEQARAEARRLHWKLDALLVPVLRPFGADLGCRPIVALREFISKWLEKPITGTGTLQEFLEYLEMFREAKGAVPLPAGEEHDAVRLMTAHSAKGLEFKQVFILRASKQSFPGNYKEPLFDFPAELRDSRSFEEDAGKYGHEQEERRLFYVAMTRARDRLAIFARRGRGKDPTPPGFVRELLHDRKLRPFLVEREAETLLELEAAAQTAISAVAGWFELPARPQLPDEPLSATAVDAYKRCPLQFKLRRDWKLPEEPAAAMQYGAVMHSVLKGYYDSVRAGRPQGEDQVLAQFRQMLTEAGMEDEHQRGLYQQQGERQLRGFLQEAARQAVEVLDTERAFRVEIGGVPVVGRLDRVDQLAADRVRIVDYKTGSPRRQKDADESLQLSLYALAAQRAWGFTVDSLVFYNLETNEAVETTRGQDELGKAEETVREVAERIAAGDFTPDPGWHCRNCGYHSLCPATEVRTFELQPARRTTGVN